MISPETLRKYGFFSFLKDAEFDQVAMITEEVAFKAGDTVFEIETDADYLYLLLAGEIDLSYSVTDKVVSGKHKDFYVGNIDPGEAFGISALMEPYAYTATCKAAKDSKALKVDAKKLLALAKENNGLGFAMMTKVAETAFERLSSVRMELVAAR